MLVLMVIILGGVGFVVKYKNQHNQLPSKSMIFSAFNHWFSGRITQGIASVKQLAVPEENTPEKIHFEFYTALPNMQPVKAARPMETQVASNHLFDADELEQDFSRELHKSEKR